MALLLLAQAALPGRVEAATVDHGLRKEAGDEAADVALLCSEIGVPHETLIVTVGDGNLQTEARNARYGALAGWTQRRELGALATAHHADDQAETLLMRLNRGSGVSGLAGVRARGRMPGSPLPLLRPLLGWRRQELAMIVAMASVKAAQDPSNHDDRFDRVRFRNALVQADWLDVPAIAVSAAYLGEADAALEWAAAREWAEAVDERGLGIIYRPQAPRAIALRVVTRIVAKLDGAAPRGSAAARLFDALLAGQTASIGNLVARPTHEGWCFSPAPKRRFSGSEN